MKKLICPNCKHEEQIHNLNKRENTKMFLAKLHLQHKVHKNLDIYTFICFECSHITNYAADIMNSSGRSIDGVEYLETYKYDDHKKNDNYWNGGNDFSGLKNMALDLNIVMKWDHIIKLFEKLK